MGTPHTQEDNRTWAIYENDQIVFELQQGTRKWELWENDYPTERDFRTAVENELAALENMGDRLGRGFTVTPLRTEVAPGRYHTVAWRFQDAFVPALKVRQPDEVEEPEGEPEQVAA